MQQSGLTHNDLEKLIPEIVDHVSKRVVDSVKQEFIPKGGYDCTGDEFSCLNNYECENVDDCHNRFDCPNTYTPIK